MRKNMRGFTLIEIMLVMVIIYVNSLSLLIGFELNVSIHSLKAIAENREERESAEAENPSHS